MRTRRRVRLPKRRYGSDLRILALFRLLTSFVVLACTFQRTGLAQPIQEPKGTAVIVGAVLGEGHVPVARAQVQVFSAVDVRAAASGSQPLGRSVRSASTDGTG